MHDQKKNLLPALLFVFYIAFCLSLIFSLRAISSISIALILATGIAKNKIEQGNFFSRNLKNPLFILCTLFFLIQLGSLLYATDLHEGWNDIRLKSAIVVIPFALCCCDYIDEFERRRILKWYSLILLAACLIALAVAFKKYLVTHREAQFLYHSLVSVYSGHAIQFSILVFVALTHLLETLQKKQILFRKWFHFTIILFFVGFLFLLSSKLVIAYFLVYFVATVIRSYLARTFSKTLIISCVVVLLVISAGLVLIPNPINNRFREIAVTNFNFLRQEKYRPSEYFNGLQFRMLQWRFVPQILNERKAWLTGVSVGDAQSYLDQKYISSNMYVGSPERGDKGFIGYNTHNEFLESLLQTGIPGLMVFLMIAWAMMKMVVQKKRRELSFVTILLITYSFDESVFETQYSLFIFLFFPLFFYFDRKIDAK